LAARKTAAKKKSRKAGAEPDSRGLEPAEVAAGTLPEGVTELEGKVSEAGGATLARYRDPLGGAWLLLAALPLSRVAPTPFQRDLSDAHVKRLAEVIDKVGIFLDPVIAVPAPAGVSGEARFWSPNGYHRMSALKRMGVRSITAIVSADFGLAYRILALNTEKAHGTKERALEAMRMARSLAEVDPLGRESDFTLELEDGSLVTLGFAYEARPRFAGGAYAAVLKASDALLAQPLPAVLELRQARAERLLAIDERVGELIAALKERGFESPYLRNFVVARIRPFRPRGKPAPEPDELLEHMEKAAEKFDAGKIKADQVARSAGGAE
jgi:ParB family chromosome partitioning protein